MDAGGTFALVISAQLPARRAGGAIACADAAQCRRHPHEARPSPAVASTAIFMGEVNEVRQALSRHRRAAVDLALRARFSPALDKAWFGSVVQIINHITLLSIILTGAALIRSASTAPSSTCW